MAPRHLARGLFALLACLVALAAHADIFRPAYLELREAGSNRYDVLWKVPAQGELRLAVNVRFPEGTVQLSQPQGLFADNAWIERWQVSRPGGLAEQA
ncbi:MAG: HupE/UreJ family protein, partial [Steroidobacteraceae bacterium]